MIKLLRKQPLLLHVMLEQGKTWKKLNFLFIAIICKEKVSSIEQGLDLHLSQSGQVP